MEYGTDRSARLMPIFMKTCQISFLPWEVVGDF